MSVLGTELKLARTSAKLSQQTMAVQTGVSLMAVRRAEAGEGSFETFTKLAGVLGMTVGCRTPLPAAPTIGGQLGIYRQRLGQHSGRAMAEAAGISRETVTAIEAGKIGHLGPVTT